MSKSRLDILLVERGLAESRALAQRLVMAGQVRVDGQVVLKPAASVSPQSQVQVEHGAPFVSRGGEKLQAALQAYHLDPSGLTCADVGASTGGFTDCLLQHGAERVYAIDVGYGILHWKLRQDPRVVVMERTNARYVEKLPKPVDLVTVDAAFISLKVLLPVIKNWFMPALPAPDSGDQGNGIRDKGNMIALIKPQFEAGRAQVKRGSGVIRDAAIHRQVLLEVLAFARQQGYGLGGLLRSPLLGPKGNVEFLAWLVYPERGLQEPEPLVERLFTDAQ